MKMSIMHIGFAVISLGLMMLILGLEAGGADVGASLQQSMTLNLKTASTAVTAILLGASMAGAGALLPNRYTTVTIPTYAPMAVRPSDATQRLDKLLVQAHMCLAEAPKEHLAACFQNAIGTATSLK